MQKLRNVTDLTLVSSLRGNTDVSIPFCPRNFPHDDDRLSSWGINAMIIKAPACGEGAVTVRNSTVTTNEDLKMVSEENKIDCAIDCVEGCQLEENCPNLEFKAQASKFIEETSLEKMLEMAEAAVQRRRLERASEPPKWVIPDDF